MSNTSANFCGSVACRAFSRLMLPPTSLRTSAKDVPSVSAWHTAVGRYQQGLLFIEVCESYASCKPSHLCRMERHPRAGTLPRCTLQSISEVRGGRVRISNIALPIGRFTYDGQHLAAGGQKLLCFDGAILRKRLSGQVGNPHEYGGSMRQRHCSAESPPTIL